MPTQISTSGCATMVQPPGFRITQLVYASAAVEPLSRAQLHAILTTARERNEQLGITGLLLYHEGSFLQLLEGPSEAVDTIFRRIERDPRHTRINVVLRARVQVREFEEWSMGFVDPDTLSTSLKGYIDYAEELCLYLLDETRSRHLLKLFREGSLRQHVHC